MVSPDDETIEEIYKDYFQSLVGDYLVKSPYDASDYPRRLINNANQTAMKEKYGPEGAAKSKGIGTLVGKGRFDKVITETHGNVLDKKWKETTLSGKPDWDVVIKEDVIEDILTGKVFAAKYFK